MKKIKNIVSPISFKEAKLFVTMEDIFEGDSKAKFSFGFKRRVIYLVALFIPCSMLVTFIGKYGSSNMTELSRGIGIFWGIGLILLLSFIYFQRKEGYLANYSYSNFVYQSVKLIYFSYILGTTGTDEGDYAFKLLTIFSYLLFCLVLYYVIEKNMVLEQINQMFKKDYRTSKILVILMKLTGVFIGISLAFIGFYKMNKWWLRNFIEVNQKSISLGGMLEMVVAILILAVIPLIPTYICFDPKLLIKTELLKKYPEEFRKEFECTEEKWYGED